MRDFKGMKRQRGRNRTGGNPQPSSGKPGQNANRAFDSNGPDNVKVRGHAQHVYEKYQQLARDAAAAGDPVLAENYLQHGEHYFRTLRVLQPNRPVTDIVNRDSFASGFDLDFEDAAVESAMEQADAGAAAGEAQAPGPEVETDSRQDRVQRPNYERANYERSSFDGRQDRGYGNDRSSRDFGGDRQNNDRQNNDRQSGERPFNADRQNGDRTFNNDRQNNDRQNADRQGQDRANPERNRYDNRQDRNRERTIDERAPRAESVGGEPLAATTATVTETEYAPKLRSLDGGVSEAPAFLSAAPSAPAPVLAEDGERRPRARRARRPRAEDDAPTALPESEDA